MGANRVSAIAATKRAPPPSVWATSTPPTAVVAARRTGVLDLFDLPTGRRSDAPPPRIPVEAGVPLSIALRPVGVSPAHAHTAATTASGHVVLDGAELASLGTPGPAALCYVAAPAASAPGGAADEGGGVVLAAGGADNLLLVIDPARRLVRQRHSLAALHPAVAPVCLAPAPDVRSVLLCSQALTQVCLESGKVLRRFSSSPTLPTAAIALPGPVARFATANASRYISIWDAAASSQDAADEGSETPPKRRRSSSATVDADGGASAAGAKAVVAPTASLIVPGAGGVVALSADANADGSLSIAALLQSGPVAVWLGWRAPKKNAKGMKPVQATFTVRPPAAVSPVYVAAFTGNGTLSVLYGSSLKPTTSKVSVRGVGKSGMTLPSVDENVIVGRADVSVIGGQEQAKLDLVERTSSLQVANMPAPAAPTKRKANGVIEKGAASTNEDEEDSEDNGENDDDDEVEDKSDDKESADDSEDSEHDNREEGSEEEEADDEPSIQERLKQLGINSTRSAADVSATPTIDATMHDSRVNVLLQAVRSKNMRLLDTCISKVQKRDAIRATVGQLPSDVAVGALLDLLVTRVGTFPVRGDWIVPWIREILIEHASSLVTHQRNAAVVALNSLIESRTQSLDALARLEGRLELIMGQVERLRRSQNTGLDAMGGEEFIDEESDESVDEADDDEDDANDDEAMDEEAIGGTIQMNGAKLSETTVGDEDSSDEDESDGDSEDDGDESAPVGSVMSGAQNRKDKAGIKRMGQDEEDSEDGDESDDDDDSDSSEDGAAEDAGKNEGKRNDEEDTMDVDGLPNGHSKRRGKEERPSHETNGVIGKKPKSKRASGGQKGKTRVAKAK